MSSSFRALRRVFHHRKFFHKSLLSQNISHRRYFRPYRSSFHSAQKCKIYKYCTNHCLTRFQSSSTKPPNNEIKNAETSTKFHHQVITELRDIYHWDRYKWIFSASFLVQFIGFMSYDFLILRCLSLVSASGLMIAHYGRQFFVGWFWAMMLFSANVVTLYHMFKEKYSVSLRGLNEEQRKIYREIFKPFNIRPLEFKQILKLGKFQTVKSGETLTISGLIGDKVYFIVSGQCIVLNEVNEAIGHIPGGDKKSFVGEIALIDDTQDAATATVKTNSEETRLLWWDVSELKYFLSHSKAEFRVNFINVFTSSMKMKLMGLNESFNVEKSVEFKQKNFMSIVQMLLIGKGKLKISEEENDESVQFLVEENEMIKLSVDEQMFLMQYAKNNHISESFVNEMMKKYHIDNHFKAQT